MNKAEAMELIEGQIKSVIDPVLLLNWVWLRAIINSIPKDAWETYVEGAAEIFARD